jgi:hypothetical protein
VDANDEGQIGVFFTEVDANTYKSRCERFQNIQKKMRTIFSEVVASRAQSTLCESWRERWTIAGLLQPSDEQCRVSEYYGALLIDT